MFGLGPQNIATVAGAASRNLLVLDGDTPEAYHEQQRQLAGLGIETWVVRRPANGSAHDGGGKFFLRTPVPVKSGKQGNVDILAEGRYALMPPSVHPQGGQWFFENQTATIYTLPTLTTLPWLTLEPVPPPRPYHRLPQLAWRLLSGDPGTIRRYATLSEAEAALCASLARAGCTFADALRLLRGNPGPGKFAQLDVEDPGNALRWLRLTWTNVQIWLADNDNEAGRLAQRLEQWTLSRPWPGRTGSSDRAVYLAHLSIVRQCGKDPHAASVRDLAELAGVGWVTASNANRRLTDAGLLKLEQKSIAQLANIWSLAEPTGSDYVELVHNGTLLHMEGGMECSSTHKIAHDAYRWAGLGKSGAEVLDALRRRGIAGEEELQAATGRHRTTVKRKLLRMYELGLVDPLGDKVWRYADSGDLDAAAVELGTAGVGAGQWKRQVRERRTHARGLARGRR